MRCCPACHRVWQEEHDYCPADGAGLSPTGDQDDPLIGHTLDDRYRLKELIGKGGMGFVYLAEQIGLGREVAIKMLFAERTRDPTSLARFQREARALAEIDHVGVVRVLDYGEGGGATPYIVMEKVDGRPLDEVLMADVRLSPGHALHVAAQLADGLGAAHARGVVHRDLKPANVQLDLDGNGIRTRILDFGLALLAEVSPQDAGARLTRAGVIFGTPEYMAPEQVRGRNVDARTDLYALGVVLYEMLTGDPPFVGANATALLSMQVEQPHESLLLSDLPLAASGGLKQLVDELLAKDPSDRPVDAAAVARRLREIEAVLPDPGPITRLLSNPVIRGEPEASTLDPAFDLGTAAISPTAVGSGATGLAYAATDPPPPLERSATAEVSAPVPVPPSEEAAPATLWAGLGESQEVDRALESALAEVGRKRRARWIIAALIALGAGIVVTPFLVSSLSATRGATMPIASAVTPPLQRPVASPMPALAKLDRGHTPVHAEGGVEGVPGGDTQRAYEHARRRLERELSGRGLRPRDIRAHPRARALWREQDRAARQNAFGSALTKLEQLRDVAQSLPMGQIAEHRLGQVERRLESAQDPVQLAALRALRSTMPAERASAEDSARFFRRLDEVESHARGGER